jgi:hypothetical protein
MKLRIFACSLLLICCWSCSPGRNYSPTELIPAGTVIALSADWQEVNKDQQLKKLANAPIIENLLQSFSIAPQSVAKLVLFSNRLNPRNDDIGMILSGSYDIQQVVEQLRAQNFTRQTYKEHKLYYNQTDGRTLCVVSGKLLSLGSRDMVESTLSTLDSSSKALVRQPLIRRMLESKDRHSPLEVLLAMPQEVEDMNNVVLHLSSFLMDMAGIGVIGELLNTIGFARALSCSLVRRGNRFAVEMTVAMRDENAASLISGSLNLLKRTSSLIPRQQMNSNDRAAMERFDDLKVTRNEEFLSIVMSIPETELTR